MREAKLSSKNQIVIPREARDALGLRPGEKLLVVVRGNTIILTRKPRNYAEAVRESGQGMYGQDYLDKERESW
jgi:AbrB family looped-hinge helix DNA binding protein